MSVIFCILLTNILTTRRFVFYECFSMKKITALSHFSGSRTIEGLHVTINKVGTAENQRYYRNNPQNSTGFKDKNLSSTSWPFYIQRKHFFLSAFHWFIGISSSKEPSTSVCFLVFFSKLTGCQRNKVVKLYIGRLKNFPHRTLLS